MASYPGRTHTRTAHSPCPGTAETPNAQSAPHRLLHLNPEPELPQLLDCIIPRPITSRTAQRPRLARNPSQVDQRPLRTGPLPTPRSRNRLLHTPFPQHHNPQGHPHNPKPNRNPPPSNPPHSQDHKNDAKPPRAPRHEADHTTI